MSDSETIWLLLFGVLGLWLVTQRWFWLVAGYLGGLASFFGMVASVIHFQILAAMGLFFVMVVCGWIVSLAQDD